MKKLLVAVCSLFAIVSVAYAHSGATGVVKTRMDNMNAIELSLKAIASGLKPGQVDKAVLVENAEKLALHAALIPTQFAEENLDKPSEASPAIWKEMAQFNAIAADLVSSSQQFSALATNGASIGVLQLAIQTVSQTCRACHSDYILKN